MALPIFHRDGTAISWDSKIEEIFFHWLQGRADRRHLERVGMTIQCPWCRQEMNSFDKTRIEPAGDTSPFDMFTCGNCDGESVWEFGPVWMPRHLGCGPKPAWGAE